MPVPERYDPFELGLREPHRPRGPEVWPARDSTSCGATARHVPQRAEPDVLSELKLISGAAVLGLTLAVATAFTLRAMSEPATATPAAQSEPAPAEPAPTAVAEPAPAAVAEPAPAEIADAEPLRTVQSDLSAPAARLGAEADRRASEIAEALAATRAERARRRAEARAAEAAEAAARAVALHAASGDDIINLDERDEADAPDDAPAKAEGATSWTEVRARQRALRSASERHRRKPGAKGEEKVTKGAPKPPEEPEKAAKPAGPFDRDAATSAMFGAAGSAGGCATGGGPSGRGKASVTLSPAGRVSSVSVGPPFAGTKTGSCVASLFRSVAVPPFTGGAVTLQKSFRVPASATVASDDDRSRNRKKSRGRKRRR